MRELIEFLSTIGKGPCVNCQAMPGSSFKNRVLFIYIVIKIDNCKKCSDLNYGEKI
jgi:hypothetical protein